MKIEKWPVRAELKASIDVEAHGRRMQLVDFADLVWRLYIENRPDFVRQNEDGRLELVSVKRSAPPHRTHNQERILEAVAAFMRKFENEPELRKTLADLLEIDERILSSTPPASGKDGIKRVNTGSK